MLASSAFSTFGGFVNDIIGFSSSLTSSAYRKNQIRLQQAQTDLDIKATYRSNLDQLMQIGDAYADTQLQIKQAQANLASSEEWLSRYGDYYDYVMGQQQLGVDQSIGSLEGLIYQGLSSYQAQNANWQNQLTRAAEIGQSGGTAKLLAAAQRQNIINTFGADMTVDAEGGTFGRQMQMQNDAVNLTRMGMEQTGLDLEADRQSVINSMGVITDSMKALEDAKNYYYDSFIDSLGEVMKQGHQAGYTYDDLSKEVDKYREYFSASDAEYADIKSRLLDQWKPIDFEIRQDWYTYDRSDENSHISDYVTNIYDKATGKLATQEQLENILRTYAGNLNEKDWYTKGNGGQSYRLATSGVTSQGLSQKALNAIIKNSNYNKRKDYK